MPKQLVLSRVKVDLSIVEFDLNHGEDLFLTYTWERAEGPDIRRAGQGPPYMNLIGGRPGETTTDPFGLRLGTWLIQEEMRQDELKEAREKLREAQANRDQQAIRALELTIDELERPAGKPGSIRAHDTVFVDLYSGYEITGLQGCGDLRHLIQMPNLNPPKPLYPGESPGPGGRYRLRRYFNQDLFDDVWFGEEAFLRDHTQNLLRAALSGPASCIPHRAQTSSGCAAPWTGRDTGR